MKTKSLILASVIATVISAPTMAADWFIGGGVGAQENTYKGSYVPEIQNPIAGGPQTQSVKETESNAVYELRAGVYLNDNNRVYGTYSYNSDDFSKQQSFLMSYDYLVGLGDSNKLNWFIGATAGMNHISPDASTLDSKNTFVWGGQTGIMYKINDNLSTEIGYRYLKQDYEENLGPEAVPYNGAVVGTETASLNDSQQLYLSVDYRF
ncbi:PhoP/Q and low Mg2+ inducible outer membrane protein H1 [Shewanella sp. c952]|uniref:outer membrane beta-barrel protein n=1 Tax=Shewanella sp. c952 TaxID=2815913 RepID=UPI001BC217C7|nr:outer membrane beta-barrel protein [Shewanella sp. c952]GIU19583.1 PhoP/Q and low Mg2+ inducible outer membrane protein H1 [Shewanella sp. c952]